MKIRTQLVITTGFFGVLLVAIIVSVLISNREIERVNDQEKIAENVAQGANDLGYLANEYLIYKQNEQLARWQSRFAWFKNQVASLRLDSPGQHVLLSHIRANSERIQEVLDNVVSSFKGSTGDRNLILDMALIRLSWSRVAVQSQGLIADGSELVQLLRNEAIQLTRINMMVIFATFIVFGAYFFFSYLMVQRRVLKSISILRHGAAIIGAGNLDFRIKEEKNNEIGDLSRAFNRMAMNLKEVTASKTDMEREINERKKAEEQLVFHAGLLGGVHDAVVATDRNDRIIYFNKVAERMFGWSAEEAVGKKSMELFQAVMEGAQQKDSVETLMKTGRYEGEVRYRRKDGSFFPADVRSTVQIDPEGHLKGIIIAVRDITERKLADKTLRESEERLRVALAVRIERKRLYDVLETLPVMVCLLTQDYHVTFANRAFRMMFGESHDRECYDYKYGLPGPCNFCETFKVLETDTPHHWECTSPQGRIIDVYDYPFVDTDGSKLVLEMDIDITERRHAESALLATQMEMAKAKRLSDVGTLAATVAHELRNPLAAIRMAAYNIRRKAKDQALDVDNHLFTIEKKVIESSQIINNLLFYSRLKPPNLESVNINEILEDSVEGAQKQAKRNVTVRRNMNLDEKIIIAADPLQIKEICNNILNNAYDAVQDKGGVIDIGIVNDDETISIVIRDNGIGIDKDQLEKVFDPFFTTKTQGTGLGLAVCRQMVDMHGGRIGIDSEPGKGTMVTVTLPKTEKNPPESPPPV
jgi:PAS domain S-box-containing protein